MENWQDYKALECSASLWGLLSSSCGGLKSPLGPQVILTEGQSDEQTDNGFKGFRCRNVEFKKCYEKNWPQYIKSTLLLHILNEKFTQPFFPNMKI